MGSQSGTKLSLRQRRVIYNANHPVEVMAQRNYDLWDAREAMLKPYTCDFCEERAAKGRFVEDENGEGGWACQECIDEGPGLEPEREGGREG